VEQGKPTYIKVTIKNIGNADITNAFYVYGYYNQNQNPDEYIEIYGLKAGYATTFTWLNSFLNEGLNSLHIKVDTPNNVPEKDETNNEKTFAINVKPAKPPDLAVSDIAWDKTAAIYDNLDVTFTITISNLGGNIMPSNWRYKIIIDSDPKQTYTYWGTVIIGYATYEHTYTLSVGSHTIKVVVDCENIVKEENELNNEKTITITVMRKPIDLKVIDILWEPNRPLYPKENVRVKALIKNVGEGQSNRFYIKWYRCKNNGGVIE